MGKNDPQPRKGPHETKKELSNRKSKALKYMTQKGLAWVIAPVIILNGIIQYLCVFYIHSHCDTIFKFSGEVILKIDLEHPIPGKEDADIFTDSNNVPGHLWITPFLQSLLFIPPSFLNRSCYQYFLGFSRCFS